MGLFDKKECVLCGGKAGLITRYKISDGSFICGSCRGRMSSNTTGFGNMSADDARGLITLKESNDDRFQNNFVITREFDLDSSHRMMAVNDETGEFAILKDANPDIFSFDDVQNFFVDLNTRALNEEERKNDSSLTGLLTFLFSDDFRSRFPEIPHCPRGSKITGMYFEIVFGHNPFWAEKIRIDMMPGWLDTETDVEKAYVCANDMYQCFKEYKNGTRFTRAYEQPAAQPGAMNSNAIEQVRQLKELLDMGALTQEEFDTKKKELLGL